ncbi:hypothetical protein RvY_13910-2 [Ramazzottius varieornatus]|uniref:Uncharacterized protein n=1 Tax=Ramazzottius varieornatus TaxID=947166 RepID=A0A1D1VWX1_RAMVA|nr:hypothetical protein RvY_13910-2 [Ramazzottius varieornatus]
MAKKTQKARKVGRTAAKVSKAQVQKESARLEEVDKELQARMDQPYVAGLTVHRLRFMEGEDVVVLIDGLYFRGLVRHHYRLIPSLYPHSNDIHFRIPTYTISFDGFNQNNDAEIAENELISRDGSDAVAVFGMLYAHFWNELWRKWQVFDGDDFVGSVLDLSWTFVYYVYYYHHCAVCSNKKKGCSGVSWLWTSS